MSMDRSDWKHFLILSPNMRIRDVSADIEGIVVNGVAPGEWVAVPMYNDDEFDMLDGMVLATKEMAEFLTRRESKKKARDVENHEINVEDGIVSAFDKRIDGDWPVGYKLDDKLRNPKLDEKWGEPEDKELEDAFTELAYHLAVDGQGGDFMRVESASFGAFAGLLGAKKVKCSVMRDRDTMLADVIDIRAKR